MSWNGGRGYNLSSISLFFGFCAYLLMVRYHQITLLFAEICCCNSGNIDIAFYTRYHVDYHFQEENYS